jgi:hypothetical protein
LPLLRVNMARISSLYAGPHAACSCSVAGISTTIVTISSSSSHPGTPTHKYAYTKQHSNAPNSTLLHSPSAQHPSTSTTQHTSVGLKIASLPRGMSTSHFRATVPHRLAAVLQRLLAQATRADPPAHPAGPCGGLCLNPLPHLISDATSVHLLRQPLLRWSRLAPVAQWGLLGQRYALDRCSAGLGAGACSSRCSSVCSWWRKR